MNYKETLFFVGKCLTITHEDHNKTIVEKEIKSVSGRLNNENFVSKAPDHVIAENKKGLEEAKEKADKIKQALERLASMQ